MWSVRAACDALANLYICSTPRCTCAAIDFHSHRDVISPFHRNEPDVTCRNLPCQFVVHSAVSVLITTKYLKRISSSLILWTHCDKSIYADFWKLTKELRRSLL